MTVASVEVAPPRGELTRIGGLLDIPPELYLPERDIPVFLTIKDVDGSGPTRFFLNRAQQRFMKDRANREVVLKARQMGFTTLLLADNLMRALKVGNVNMVIVAQKEKLAAVKLRQVNEWLDELKRKGWPIVYGIKNAQEIELLFPINVGIWIESADGEGAGRGRTVHILHNTESAFWLGDAERKAAGLIGSMPNPPWSLVTDESTPNGAAGRFFNQYRDAKTGKNGYKPFFFPWWWDDRYRLPNPPASVKKTLTEEERFLIEQHHLDLEQILWRRIKMAELGEYFAQEFPEDDRSCFLTSGKAVFKLPIVKRMEQRQADPLRIADIEDLNLRTLANEFATFNQNSQPAIKVWKEPVVGAKYILAGDASLGVGGDADASAAAVIDFNRLEHVATFRSNRIQPTAFAKMLDRLGRAYNEAYLAVERRTPGETVIGVLYGDLGYPNLCHESDDPRNERSFEPTYENCGVMTSVASKPQMVERFRELCRTGNFTTYDSELINEVSTYVYDDARHQVNPEARVKERAELGAHDDLLMAAMIGCFVHSWATFATDYQQPATRTVLY